MKPKTESKAYELAYGFADLVCASGVWVSAFRNYVTSKDFVFKQLKKFNLKFYIFLIILTCY